MAVFSVQLLRIAFSYRSVFPLKNRGHILSTVISHLNAITQNHFTQLHITIRYYTI